MAPFVFLPRFWLVVQPKLTSLGLLQVVRTEESQSSSILLVILLLAVGAGTGISIDSHSHGKSWQDWSCSQVLALRMSLLHCDALLLGLLYVGTVLLKPAPLPSLEDVLQEEETREEALCFREIAHFTASCWLLHSTMGQRRTKHRSEAQTMGHPPALVVGFLAGEERAAARTIVRKVSQLQSNFHKHVVMLSPTQIISSGFQLVIVFNFSGCPKWTQDDNNKVSDCTVSGCFFRGQMNISWKHGHMIIFQWFFQGGTMAWIWARATRLAKTRESGAFQKSWLDANAAALWESLAAGLLVTGYCYFVGRRGFILDDSAPRHLSLLSLSSFDIY